PGHHGGGGGGRAAADADDELAGGGRAGGDRLTARRGRGDRHRPATAHPLPPRHGARGREPHQRRRRAGALSHGGGGGPDRRLRADVVGLAVRPGGGGRRGDRPAGQL